MNSARRVGVKNVVGASVVGALRVAETIEGRAAIFSDAQARKKRELQATCRSSAPSQLQHKNAH